MDNLKWLQKMTGESDTELLSLLLADAEEFVQSYTNRSQLIAPLQKPARDLALMSYNRMGTEGETGRSEGGESYDFDVAPKAVYDVLDRYRLAGVGGRRYEAKKESAETVQPPGGNSTQGQ